MNKRKKGFLAISGMTAVSVCICVLLGIVPNRDYRGQLVSTSRRTSSISTPTRPIVRPPTLTPYPPIPIAIVIVDSVNIRQGPGIDYPILAVAFRNDEFMIVGQNNDSSWLAILIAGGNYAWMTGNPNYVTVTRQHVNVADFYAWERGVRAFESTYHTRRPSTSTGYDHQESGGQEDASEQVNQGDVDHDSSGGAVCVCSYNAYDCADFGTQLQAQACYQYCLNIVGIDVHHLDGDGDGIACELNP